MSHRPSPEPFEGVEGTHFVHDRSTGILLVTTARGGEAQVPVDDFWSFVDAVHAGPAGSPLDRLAETALELAPELWRELLAAHELRPSAYLAFSVLGRARLAAYGAPEEGRRLADFAGFLIGELAGSPGAAGWVRGLRAREEAVRGHALRLAGRLEEAGAAFRRARHLVGSGDPDIDALEMLLCLDLREFGPAGARVARAVSGFFSRGEFDRAAVALILKAGLRIVSGDFTTACEDLICAAHLVEPVVHPVAALAVEEALGVVSPRRPGAREPLPSRMGLRAVTEFEATYPCQPEASEVLAFLRGAVGRYDRSRELLRSIAALPRLRERTA